MEEEMESLERDLKAVEDSYGENMLNLTLARGYIKKLLENGKVVRFLNGNHAGILAEFEGIAAAENFEEAPLANEPPAQGYRFQRPPS